MILEQSEHIMEEVQKAFMGKEEIVKKVLMTIYAGGNILLEDCPGVGKTTLALAFSRAIGFDYKRIQFTTDTMPSDITGYTMYNHKANEFEYHPGAVDCNFLLADEINRTSPKTQAALLEAMQEKKVTVDGVTHALPNPFICIATQNPYGAAGTQPLPDSQLDRFMVCLSIGYPSRETQMQVIRASRYHNPLEEVREVCSAESIKEVQGYLSSVFIEDSVLDYLIHICEATREDQNVEQGVSPRGVLALSKMAKARAVLESREYVTPEDVQSVYVDVCAHRIQLRSAARIEGVTARRVLTKILKEIKPPVIVKGNRG